MISLLGLSVAYVLLGMFVQSIATFVMLAMLQAILGSASSPLAYTRAINTVFQQTARLGAWRCPVWCRVWQPRLDQL